MKKLPYKVGDKFALNPHSHKSHWSFHAEIPKLKKYIFTISHLEKIDGYQAIELNYYDEIQDKRLWTMDRGFFAEHFIPYKITNWRKEYGKVQIRRQSKS